MWALMRPSSGQLDALLERVSKLSLSYPDAEMTRTRTSPPPGYGREHHRTDLSIDLALAREAVASFATHRLPYLFVHPDGARAEKGRDVIVCARLGPMWTINPCRIVYVEESMDRYCYAYGTLPGHSEHGEETFSVERIPSGGVRAETLAYAKPQDVLARLGSPVAHVVQRRIKRDYMKALETYLPRSGMV